MNHCCNEPLDAGNQDLYRALQEEKAKHEKLQDVAKRQAAELRAWRKHFSTWRYASGIDGFVATEDNVENFL